MDVGDLDGASDEPVTRLEARWERRRAEQGRPARPLAAGTVARGRAEPYVWLVVGLVIGLIVGWMFGLVMSP